MCIPMLRLTKGENFCNFSKNMDNILIKYFSKRHGEETKEQVNQAKGPVITVAREFG